MNEELSSRHINATAERAALERERESTDPEHRSTIDAQLVNVRDVEQTTRRQLDEQNGFSGTPQAAVTPEQLQAQVEQAQQPQGPRTIYQKEVSSGERITGALGAAQADRIIETHVHPDIAEARLANARTAQVREQLAGEQAARDAAKAREDERKAVDQVRAERVFEGGHAPGNFGTQDYLKIESTHWQTVQEFARRGTDKEDREAAESVALAGFTEETGIEYVTLSEEMMIEGEIVAQAIVRDESYFAVEFTREDGQLARALVPASGSGHAIGDEVQVERRRGYHIDSAYGYGR
jgi:hypothetical protein